MGGTCLNVGCIPSKTLLDSSHHYDTAIKDFEEHGIKIENISINFARMMERKVSVVRQTSDGVKYLMDKNKVDVFTGVGTFKDPTHLIIAKDNDTNEEIESTYSIIATGSKPSELLFYPLIKSRLYPLQKHCVA